ncbi:Neutral endopeptidase [Nocardia otitidiscaviarum]|uniref:Neutral endopeptidase n=1 Tax=Nocardia otitidiscaviarum TaxID=1823 RepID=A0A378YJD2_9NOCA|nr:M13 family metallopeptidase [Nocardia otitidiscaviarum]SUA76529.1 Neutral endopeptidase [Nocardia otitidiscaviarum]
MTSSGPVRIDRRAFLVALGLVPTAAWLASCSSDDAPTTTSTTTPLKGPDLSGADQAVRPQDDLYRNVNGTWLREYELPPDKVSFGTFDEVGDRVEEQLRGIIEGITEPQDGTEAQQIRDLYDARMDIDEIERLGMTPLADLFARIDAADGKTELAKVMAGLPVGGIIGLGVTIDRKNSSAHVAAVGQSGLGLSEQYYRKPEYADKLAAYKTFLESIAKGAGFDDPAGMATRVLDLETRIAAGFWDNVRNRDTDATYNKMSWDEMTALAPQFDWDPWLAGQTDRPKNLFDTIIVHQPSYLTHAGNLWHDTDLGLWRDYLKIYLVREFARFLPKTISDANFEFFGTVMNGLEERPERWKSAVATVNSNLGEPLGKLYVAQHFPPEAKDRALEMVDDLKAAYRDNFRASTWMSPATRDAAIEKLEKMGAKIGYPDKWEDYSDLKITRGKLIESLRAVNAFEVERMFGYLGKPVDKSEWSSPPQTVNAFYSPVTNEIVFPAAFLQPPFFDKDAAPAVNYGAGGAVIGHEIGHGFDDQGSKYDADGNLKDWWTPEDRTAFEARTQKLVEQYDVLVPAGLDPEQTVNGELTLGENVADVRGLQMSIAALAIAERRRGIETPDYKPLFESWARNWRDKSTRQYTENLLANDTHAPNEFRANQVVRNLEQFYTSYDVQESDKLFLPQDQRVTF